MDFVFSPQIGKELSSIRIRIVFKLDVDENGNRYLRPMLVGSIKNDYARRTACTLVYPVTILAVIIFNLLIAVLSAGRAIFRAIYHPLKSAVAPWNSSIWDRPRNAR